MAIYHCRMKVHSRGPSHRAGKAGADAPSATRAASYRTGTRIATSAVRAAAYRAGGELVDAEGVVHDFTRKQGVVWNGILAPEGAPAWVFDRGELWRAVDAFEKRKDAQLFREVELTVPRELSREEGIRLVREFVLKQFVALGMVADIGYHEPKASDGGRQPHAHVSLLLREPLADDPAKPGEHRFGLKRRDWNGARFTSRKGEASIANADAGGLLRATRQAWQDACNRALGDAGSDARVDHRSFKDRGLSHEPLPHQGQAIHVRVPSGRYHDRREEHDRAQFHRRTHATARAAAARRELDGRGKPAGDPLPGPDRITLVRPAASSFDTQTRDLARALRRVGRQPGFKLAEDGVALAADMARWLRGQDAQPVREPDVPELGGYDR